MKNDDTLFILGFFAVLILGIASAGAFVYSQVGPGRYQMQQTASGVLVLDTVTGEVESLPANGNRDRFGGRLTEAPGQL